MHFFRLILALVFFAFAWQALGQKGENGLEKNLEMDFECGDSEFKHCLEQVWYSGASAGDYIEIGLDIDKNIIFEAPHFVNVFPSGGCEQGSWGTINLPIAYKSGGKPRVMAVFKTSFNTTHYIRGIGPEGMLFEEQSVMPSGGEVTYEFTDASKGFDPGETRYFENFIIHWQASETGGNTGWVDIDVDVDPQNGAAVGNPLYVLKTGTSAGWYSTPYHYTTVHTSCVLTDGLTDENAILQKIYETFKTKKIKRQIDGHVLTYWNNNAQNNGACRSVEDLLLYGNGQCQAYADFLEACLNIQGITVNQIQVATTPDGLGNPPPNVKTEIEQHISNSIFGPDYSIQKYHMMAVRNWDKTEEFIFMGQNTDLDYLIDIDGGGEAGVTGQGGNEPRSLFITHRIIEKSGNYFDPSYGTDESLITSHADWEDESVDIVHAVVFTDLFDAFGNEIYPARHYVYVKKINTQDFGELFFIQL